VQLIINESQLSRDVIGANSTKQRKCAMLEDEMRAADEERDLAEAAQKANKVDEIN